jgi:hypothetical protein
VRKAEQNMVIDGGRYASTSWWEQPESFIAVHNSIV